MNFFKILFLILILWIIGFGCFVQQISKDQTSLTQKSDAIIVLTGAKGRIDVGLHLLQQKQADHLFISGVGYKVELEDLSKYLTSFPASQVKNIKNSITLGHFANTTEENAIESSVWVKQNNFNKIILVTSNYHMPRSLYLFKKYMPEVTIIPYSFTKEMNIKASLNIAFLEYNKFLVALIA